MIEALIRFTFGLIGCALEITQIVFIVLRVIKYINWSWWWVLSPFWIPITLIAVLIVIYIIADKLGLT